jgi:hypothetical protein
MRNNYADNDAQAEFKNQAPTGNTGVTTITVAADEDQFWVLDWIALGTSATSTLEVKIGGVRKLYLTHIAAGAHSFDFSAVPIYAGKNQALEVILNGGSSATGHLNIRYR